MAQPGVDVVDPYVVPPGSSPRSSPGDGTGLRHLRDTARQLLDPYPLTWAGSVAIVPLSSVPADLVVDTYVRTLKQTPHPIFSRFRLTDADLREYARATIEAVRDLPYNMAAFADDQCIALCIGWDALAPPEGMVPIKKVLSVHAALIAHLLQEALALPRAPRAHVFYGSFCGVLAEHGATGLSKTLLDMSAARAQDYGFAWQFGVLVNPKLFNWLARKEDAAPDHKLHMDAENFESDGERPLAGAPLPVKCWLSPLRVASKL